MPEARKRVPCHAGSLKKLALLSKHIERLMEHIKHEAVAKARAVSYRRKTFRERNLLRCVRPAKQTARLHAYLSREGR
jgi:hypothetical protein